MLLGSITEDTSAVLFGHYFHTALSDTTLEGHECAASPCALAALLFAEYFLGDPDDLQDSDVSDKLYNQVVGAIRKAINIYQLTYNKQPVILKTAEACKLLQKTGNIHFEVISSERSSTHILETVTDYSLQLQQNQALIVHCENPYRVVSIVNARHGEGMLVFSSQQNCREYPDIYNGPFLIYSKKNESMVHKMSLTLLINAMMCGEQAHQLTVVQKV